MTFSFTTNNAFNLNLGKRNTERQGIVRCGSRADIYKLPVTAAITKEENLVIYHTEY